MHLFVVRSGHGSEVDEKKKDYWVIYYGDICDIAEY